MSEKTLTTESSDASQGTAGCPSISSPVKAPAAWAVISAPVRTDEHCGHRKVEGLPLLGTHGDPEANALPAAGAGHVVTGDHGLLPLTRSWCRWIGVTIL